MKFVAHHLWDPEKRRTDPQHGMPASPPLPSVSIHLGHTKTSGAENDEVVYLTGRPVDALNVWLEAAKIDKGSIFRAVRSIQRLLMTSSNSAQSLPSSTRRSFRHMDSTPAF